MNRLKSRAVWILAALLLLAGVTAASIDSRAQGGYDLSWWTVDGGGLTASAGPGYVLVGTIGQPDAGSLGGEGYRLEGGFWGSAEMAGRYGVYLPLIVRR
jgi:hypothetical protein